MLHPTLQFFKGGLNFRGILLKPTVVKCVDKYFSIREIHEHKTTSLSITPKTDPQSEILSARFKEASSIEQITTLIQENKSNLTAKHCAQALRHVVFNLRPAAIATSDLTALCNALTRKARFLNVNEVVNVLSDLKKLQISPRTIVVQTMLQHLRSRINSLSFKQIFFLETMYKRVPPTPLLSAVQTALPIVVQNHLHMQMNHDDLHELVQLFRFAAFHRFHVSDVKKIAEAIVKSKSEWTAIEASTVLWGFTSLNQNNVHEFDDLMKTAAYQLSRNIQSISTQEFINLLNFLQKRDFLSRVLFKLATQKAHAEKWDLKNVHLLARIAMESRYIDMNFFIMYSEMVDRAIGDKSLDISIYEVVEVLSKINYSPPQNLEFMWNRTKQQLTTDQLHPKAIMNLILNLVTLGLPLNAVRDSIFEKYDLISFMKENADSNLQTVNKLAILLQLIGCGDQISEDLKKSWLEKLAVSQFTNNESIGLTLKKAVHSGLLQNFHICDSVLTKSGIYIDHLLMKKADLSFETSQLDRLSDGKVVLLPNQFPADVKRIAIVLRTLKDYAVDSLSLYGHAALVSRVLQQEGFHTIEICYEEWRELLEKEHASFISRAVNESYSNA